MFISVLNDSNPSVKSVSLGRAPKMKKKKNTYVCLYIFIYSQVIKYFIDIYFKYYCESFFLSLFFSTFKLDFS